MKSYSQPDFYRFGHDSIYLAKVASFLAANITKDQKVFQGLDIGSGSGVVAIECILRLTNLSLWQWHLIEKQNEFKMYLEENINQAKLQESITVYHEDFFDWSLNENCNSSFDLIVSNPPYYTSGQLSPDVRRQLCRHWSDGSWQKFIQQGLILLRPNGIFIFLFHDSKYDLIKKEIDNQELRTFLYWKIFKDQSICLGIIGRLHVQADELLSQLRVANIIK